MIPGHIGIIPASAVIYLLTVIAFSISGYYFYRRVLHPAFSGRPGDGTNQPWKRLAGALIVVFSQKCSLRHLSAQDRAGIGHLVIFWSFIAFVGSYVIFIYGEAAYPGFTLLILGEEAANTINWFLDIVGLCLLGVLAWAAMRRYVAKPHRLSSDLARGHDALIILVLVAALVLAHFLAGSFFYVESGASGITLGPVTKTLGNLLVSFGLSLEGATTLHAAFWWFHLAIILSLAIYIPFSKHSHIIVTPLAIFLRSLRHRGTLELVKNLEESRRYGSLRVRDFTWKQLLDGYSCAICGRCSDACPATTSGKSLSPMHVIYRIRQCLIEMARGDMDPTLFDDGISEESVWDCTTCFACQQECPNMIEHVNLIVELRRHLVQQGRVNRSAAKAMEAMLLQGNHWEQPQRTRLNWAEGHSVSLIQSRPKVEVLYWIGCAGAYDFEAIRTSKAMLDLLDRAGVDYAVLGKEELCCGDAARRMGEEGLFQTLAYKNLQILGKYNFGKLVTHCPHCYNTFKNEYPQLGAQFEVIHHSELLLELIREGRINIHRGRDLRLTFHDPCYLGRYNGLYDAPREVLRAIPKVILAEPNPCREKSLCCGAGGGQIWIQSEKGRRMEDVRFEQLLQAAPSVIATACPYCTIMLSAAASGKEASGPVKIMDIAELIAEACRS